MLLSLECWLLAVSQSVSVGGKFLIVSNILLQEVQNDIRSDL